VPKETGSDLLTLTACAIDIVAVIHSEISHGRAPQRQRSSCWHSSNAVSDLSGAHLNPVVTFAFALRGVFAWRRLPGVLARARSQDPQEMPARPFRRWGSCAA
jgi:aquaporin Z